MPRARHVTSCPRSTADRATAPPSQEVPPRMRRDRDDGAVPSDGPEGPVGSLIGGSLDGGSLAAGVMDSSRAPGVLPDQGFSLTANVARADRRKRTRNLLKIRTGSLLKVLFRKDTFDACRSAAAGSAKPPPSRHWRIRSELRSSARSSPRAR